jgi:hypothetical protein
VRPGPASPLADASTASQTGASAGEFGFGYSCGSCSSGAASRGGSDRGGARGWLLLGVMLLGLLRPFQRRRSS